MTQGSAQPTVSEPCFWEGIYQQRGDGWELGQPAPPLVEYLQQCPPSRGRVAVLGCGRGHDARLFARLGYQVWGFDFASQAIREGQALASREGLEIHFEQRDLFALPHHYPGYFHGIWEYACFCAIDPARRPQYVEVIRQLLAPGGWLLACFYPLRRGKGGPPFPMSRTELGRLFRPHFTFVEAYVPTTSVPQRQGAEWFVHLIPKTGTRPEAAQAALPGRAAP